MRNSADVPFTAPPTTVIITSAPAKKEAPPTQLPPPYEEKKESILPCTSCSYFHTGDCVIEGSDLAPSSSSSFSSCSSSCCSSHEQQSDQQQHQQPEEQQQSSTRAPPLSYRSVVVAYSFTAASSSYAAASSSPSYTASPSAADVASSSSSYAGSSSVASVPAKDDWRVRAKSQPDVKLCEDNGRKLFLKNLGLDVTKNKLKAHFKKFGQLEDIYVLPGGFGVVKFETLAAADKAMDEEWVIDGRKVSCRKFLRKDKAKLFVGGTGSLNEGELEDYFSTLDLVAFAEMLTDNSGLSKGFGFVSYSEDRNPQEFVGIHTVKGRRVTVECKKYESSYKVKKDVAVKKDKPVAQSVKESAATQKERVTCGELSKNKAKAPADRQTDVPSRTLGWGHKEGWLVEDSLFSLVSEIVFEPTTMEDLIKQLGRRMPNYKTIVGPDLSVWLNSFCGIFGIKQNIVSLIRKDSEPWVLSRSDNIQEVHFG